MWDKAETRAPSASALGPIAHEMGTVPLSHFGR